MLQAFCREKGTVRNDGPNRTIFYCNGVKRSFPRTLDSIVPVGFRTVGGTPSRCEATGRHGQVRSRSFVEPALAGIRPKGPPKGGTTNGVPCAERRHAIHRLALRKFSQLCMFEYSDWLSPRVIADGPKDCWPS